MHLCLTETSRKNLTYGATANFRGLSDYWIVCNSAAQDMWILLSVTLYLSTFIYNLNSSYFLHGMFWCHEDRLWNENILVSPDMASWVFDLVRLCFLAFFIGYVTKRWIINQKSFGWNNHGFDQPVSHALAPRTNYVKITINMTHSSFELTCENFVNV